MAKKEDKSAEFDGGLVETKLTKGEMIDLILEDVTRNANAEVTAFQQERRDVIASVPRKVLDRAIKDAELGLEIYSGNEYGTGCSKTTVTIRVKEVDPTNAPILLDALEQCKRIDKELRRLNDVRSSLNDRTAAKNYILRTALEKSDDGRALLEQIKGFAVGLETKMLAAGDEKK